MSTPDGPAPRSPAGSPVPAAPPPSWQPATVPPPPHPLAGAAPSWQPAAAPPVQQPAAKPRRPRITGIDVARAVAILGMLVAHLGTGHASDAGWGAQWMWIFDGRSSALFATLAGVSITLMSRSAATPTDWRGVRTKIAVRAAILLPLGGVLQAIGYPVVVILSTYAVLFLMALPVLRLPSRWLLVLAGVAMTLGPVVVLGLREATTGTAAPSVLFGFGLGELVWGYYPALVWIGYLLVGMVLGRGALAARSFALALVGGGTGLAIAAYGAGSLLTAALAPGQDRADLGWPLALVSVEPHGNSPFEVIGNAGVALAVTGLCLLATSWRAGSLLLSPLAATGAMSLTIYTVQLLVIGALGEHAVWFPESNGPLLALAIGSIVFATIWRHFLGKGPLERALSGASDAAARAVVRSAARPAR
ncbi:DUF418 domain-containing protein [Miniimonas arenae]|uniref:DUF418 domain-containing protein n=1 Tax=Miniimonas arenae TaxID=676201 RepID=UPI0028AB1D47|nr:heparan-alpha-glucosaminide N-acetyltransferase domain-containing protein [Miniimonas arenae]